jgi:hypothetical protein
MTPITRRLQRLTPAVIHSAGRGRPVIVEMSPGGDGRPGPAFLGFRLLGTRSTYYLPVEWCWREAMKMEVNRRKTERRKAKAGR